MSIETRKHQYGKVFGHWQIREMLGQGSNGKSAVFRLEHSDASGIESALKAISLIEEKGKLSNLSPERRRDYEQAREKRYRDAEREVMLMDSLRGNTNVVDYMDHSCADWEDETGFGRDMLIRMELLRNLRDEICAGRRFDEAEIRKIGADICAALNLCHKKGILHRDIKPENIFLNRDDNYKLGDFGISRIVSSSGSSASTGIGTPQYWAPEQISGKYDYRVDIYSLGLVLYELANGNILPFARSSYIEDDEIRRRLAGENLPAPRNVSPALGSVILKACAFRPEDRFQSAEEFSQALLSGGSVSTEPRPVYETIPADPSDHWTGNVTRTRKSVPLTWALVGILALALVGVLIIHFTSPGKTEESTSPATQEEAEASAESMPDPAESLNAEEPAVPAASESGTQPAELPASDTGSAIVRQPADLEVYTGDTAKFSVAVSGNVKGYQWQYSKDGASWKNVTVSTFPDALTDTITFKAQLTHNGFYYRCVVTLNDGSFLVSDGAKLLVRSYFDSDSGESSPDSRITSQPQDLTVHAGDPVRFYVTVSEAVRAYQWQYCKDGATWKNITVEIFPDAVTNSISFIAQDAHNGFSYRCVIRFEDGSSEISEAATITVN